MDANPRVAVGNNSAAAGETLDASEQSKKNIRVHVAKIKAAMASRKQASEQISDVTKETKARGISSSLISLAIRFDKLTDYEREALLRPSKQFTEAKENIKSLREERKEVSRSVTEAFAEAKADGHNENALRFVLKLNALDEHEREELFHLIDQYATFLRLW